MNTLQKIILVYASFTSFIYIAYFYNYIEFSKNNETYFPLFNTSIFLYNEWISIDYNWYYNFIILFYFRMVIKLYCTYKYCFLSFQLIKCIIIHILIDTIVEPFHIINFIYSNILMNLYFRILIPLYSHILLTTDSNIDIELEHTLNRNIIKSTFIEDKPECCPVCFDILTFTDKPLSCGHYIHRKCIVLSKQTRCSLCRAEIILYKKELHTIINYDIHHIYNYRLNLCDTVINYIYSYKLYDISTT